MEKKYTVKIYDRAGTTFKGNYDPIGGYAFNKTINGGVGALSINLPREFDKFGLSEDVDLLDEIQVWVQDKDSTGEKIYSGYVSSIRSYISGEQQGVTLDVLGYVSRLAFTLDWDGTDISTVRNSMTAGEIAKDVIDDYRTTVADERINYQNNNISVWAMDNDFSDPGWEIYGVDGEAGNIFVGKKSVLTGCTFAVRKSGSPTGSVYAKIYATVAGSLPYGDSGYLPSGAALATSDAVDVSTLQTTLTLQDFVFSGANKINLEESTIYAAVVSYTSGDTSNSVEVGYDSTNAFEFENGVYLANGGTWYGDKFQPMPVTVTGESNTVQIDGTDISYTSNAKSCLETIDRVREMAGANWYWYVDADNIFYFKQYPATPTHLFVFGKDISNVEITRSADDVKNEFIFYNGLQPDDTHFLSTRYYNTDSINNYWHRFENLTDGRILDDASADELAGAFIGAYKDANVSMKFEIKDNNLGDGYDIESIEPGHTCKILNLKDSSVVSSNMVITSVQYTPEKAIVYVSDLREITGRSLSNIRRQLDSTVYGDRPTDITSEAIT